MARYKVWNWLQLGLRIACSFYEVFTGIYIWKASGLVSGHSCLKDEDSTFIGFTRVVDQNQPNSALWKKCSNGSSAMGWWSSRFFFPPFMCNGVLMSLVLNRNQLQWINNLQSLACICSFYTVYHQVTKNIYIWIHVTWKAVQEYVK